ncbi:response regulator transcription factor [Herbiconiux sp. CPCC 205716]|uniref:Response regulator transcription factor n=1 Tax=Herbiconiux gentiana TaxID=2970912 RepID=A0ABT2GJY3_9MICO|nr:response regulator transcription factor [Herbiconiux gentiana]MCS5715605.1 response regulator transcription factor [Herbiconiux gentiana]
MGAGIRVLLVDDHPMIRSGLRAMLETDPAISVVGEAGDGDAAVVEARRLRPDVALVDVRMPVRDGIDATRRITAEGLAAVVVLTTFDLDEYVFGAIRAGAAGFLLKSTDARTLLEAVHRVAAGEGMLSPAVTRRVLEAVASRAPAPDAPPAVTAARASASPAFDELTPRERDVLACLAEGLGNQAIADRLVITETTAKSHVSRVLMKLGCSSRLQAAVVARDAGFAG